MPERCVAAYCSNTRENGFTLHRFPKDPALCELWTQQVCRTRAGPKGTVWKPSSSSVLCSAHFEEECYDSIPALKEQLGIDVRLKKVLLPNSVPRIFHRGTSSRLAPGANGDVKSRRSHALEKRQRLEVLQECQSEYVAEEESDDFPDGDPSTDVNSTEDQHSDFSVQVCLRPPTRTVAMQFKGRGRTKGVQATTSMVTVGTQTEDDCFCFHNTENANREQRSRHDGEMMFNLRYPKYKKGGYIVRKVLQEPSFGYAEELMRMVEAMCRGEDYNGDDFDIPDPSPVTEPLNASFEKPDKRAAVNAHMTRFSITNNT
ncbi:THAP domain-containing protein 10-like [Eleginops maclovinus]|uniref:THAP domain-containing protein 10-like n=1 Tax=Eleginops maclovinus TaxID=56733 RepID=UPI003080AB27